MLVQTSHPPTRNLFGKTHWATTAVTQRISPFGVSQISPFGVSESSAHSGLFGTAAYGALEIAREVVRQPCHKALTDTMDRVLL